MKYLISAGQWLYYRIRFGKITRRTVEMRQGHIAEEEFILFCSQDEFLDIAKTTLQRFGIPKVKPDSTWTNGSWSISWINQDQILIKGPGRFSYAVMDGGDFEGVLSALCGAHRAGRNKD